MKETQTAIQTRTSNDTGTDNRDEFLLQKKNAQSELLEVLEKVRRKIARGPAPSFNEAHVVKGLKIIGDHGTVGRISLSNKLELGIGTTRTILKHLKNEGLIVSSRYGFALSEDGKRLFQDLQLVISECVEVPNSPLSVGPVVVAVLVKDAAHRVGRGVEQRNIAIRVGASGATTLIFSRNKLIMASKRRHSQKMPTGLQDVLVSKLNPEENDAIIVGSGENIANAEIGAIMAALKLLKSQNRKYF
jgi:ribosomal protein S25